MGVDDVWIDEAREVDVLYVVATGVAVVAEVIVGK